MASLLDYLSGFWRNRPATGLPDSLAEDVAKPQPDNTQNVADSDTDGQKSALTPVEDVAAVNKCFEFLEQDLPREVPVRTVGPYTLEKQIGRGGMGTVWSAQQHEPIKRSVAVKLISPGPSSEQLVQRFESERNILALMNHPAIATMYDAGETEEGQLFFAMEVIDGPNLVDYCNDNRLTTRERLKLFLVACSAVQHAHQKGIIHRDIKPSNILVGQVDQQPQVKVIDFGLSKLKDRVTDSFSGTNHGASNLGQADVTLDGQVIGSVRYMSPEQAAGDASKIDTRADIYSLGVVLYKLLTNAVPLDRDSLEGVSVSQVIDAIQNKPNLLPSESVSRTAEAERKKTFASRSESFDVFQRHLTEDLDWIVMNAIKKDPDERYTTVSEFSADIERFLNNEPVSARPASNLYKLKKAISKNRLLWGSIAGAVVALLFGSGLASIGLVRAMNAEKVAETRLAQARSSNEVLAGIFGEMDILSIEMQSEPFKVMAARNLVTASKRLDEQQLDEPIENVKLQVKLANALNSLEFYDDAIPIGENALKIAAEEGSSPTLEFEAGAILVRSLIGAAEISVASQTLAPLLENCRQTEGPDSETYLDLLLLSGMIDRSNRDLPKAYKTFAQVAAGRTVIFGADDLRTYDAKYWMATSYTEASKPDASLPLMKEVVDFYKDKLPTGHPRTIHALLNYGWAVSDSGDFNNGFLHAEESYKLAQQTFGDNHPTTYDSMLAVGMLIHHKGDFERGKPLLEEAWEGLANSVGAKHPRAIKAPMMLAQMNERIGNYGRAIDLIEQALALSQQQYGIKVQLAETYFKAGEFEKGREMLRTMIPKGERTPEETSPFAKYFIQKIGDSYHQEGRYEEAIATLRAARAELLAADEEPYDFMMMRVVLKLARSLGKVGKYEEALQVIKSYRDEMPEEMGPKNRIRLCCDAETGVVLLMANKPNEAEAMFRSVVTSGVQLLHDEFLIKQWRLAMYEAGLEDEMLETIDQELKSYKRRFTPGSIQHAMQLRTLGYDLIDLGQRKRACELLTQSVALLKDQDPVPFNLAITQFDVARLMMELESADETKATKHENDLENAWTSLVALTPDALPIEKKAMRLSLEDLIQICEKNEAEEMAETWRIRIQNL